MSYSQVLHIDLSFLIGGTICIGAFVFLYFSRNKSIKRRTIRTNEPRIQFTKPKRSKETIELARNKPPQVPVEIRKLIYCIKEKYVRRSHPFELLYIQKTVFNYNLRWIIEWISDPFALKLIS